jgi:hypothetical protein
VIGVGGNSTSAEAMQAFVDDYEVGGFPHIEDLENVIWRRYGVSTQPTFVFIDDDGSISTAPALGEAGLAKRVSELLAT